jgi:hypothetical protein
MLRPMAPPVVVEIAWGFFSTMKVMPSFFHPPGSGVWESEVESGVVLSWAGSAAAERGLNDNLISTSTSRLAPLCSSDWSLYTKIVLYVFPLVKPKLWTGSWKFLYTDFSATVSGVPSGDVEVISHESFGQQKFSFENRTD